MICSLPPLAMHTSWIDLCQYSRLLHKVRHDAPDKQRMHHEHVACSYVCSVSGKHPSSIFMCSRRRAASCCCEYAVHCSMKDNTGISTFQGCSPVELHQLQKGLMQKELSRINANRMSDALLLKKLASPDTRSIPSVLNQVIRECGLREEVRNSREEQLLGFPGSLHIVCSPCKYTLTTRTRTYLYSLQLAQAMWENWSTGCSR